jgi:2-dehydro-3-deoxyphosphogluconate aldolase/(4S)-4-hydroxy-2-oxoglutarate aldolase
MLQKIDTLSKIRDTGVVAVLRGDSKEETSKAAVACIKGGLNAIELTFTAPHADEIIEELNRDYPNGQALIGAGTVLDASTARIAILAGAKFVVSPSFSKDVAKLCNLYSIPYIPGCMTPSDIQTALSYGSDIIKLFPAAIVGPEMISELRGPFPNVNLMATGGVTLANLKDWFDNGTTIVGVGGSLTAPAKDGDFAQVAKNAKAYRDEFNQIQSESLR